MRRVTAEEIRRIDQMAICDYSIPALLLMENAGRSVCDVISREFKACKVLIFIGKGNNGGDGFVVARHLVNHGYSVQLVLLADPAQFKAELLLNFSIVGRMNIPWILFSAVPDEKVTAFCRETELIVDAIFGIGIHSPLQGVFEKAVIMINKSQKPVVSIDIPSGLDADTGQVHGVAVKATTTVTLALPKRGLFERQGPEFAGVVEVADIGVPRDLLYPS